MLGLRAGIIARFVQFVQNRPFEARCDLLLGLSCLWPSERSGRLPRKARLPKRSIVRDIPLAAKVV